MIPLEHLPREVDEHVVNIRTRRLDPYLSHDDHFRSERPTDRAARCRAQRRGRSPGIEGELPTCVGHSWQLAPRDEDLCGLDEPHSVLPGIAA